jgi:hypothetical protein
MEKNVLESSPLKPVSQYSKWSLGGQLPKLCSVILISVQNGRRKLCLLMAAILDEGRGHRTQF